MLGADGQALHQVAATLETGDDFLPLAVDSASAAVRSIASALIAECISCMTSLTIIAFQAETAKPGPSQA